MTLQIQYHLLLPKTQALFTTNDLTFSINKIRSRRPSVAYPRLHLFDMSGDLIESIDGERWVIGTVYEHRESQFTITDELLSDAVYTQIELVLLGIDSENPLYFTEVMFQEGVFTEYHQPNEEIIDEVIKFNKNTYTNLYKPDGNYVQVIRPNQEEFKTTELSKAEVTILAPHFEDDSDFDDDVAVFIEAMNQREQTIDVLR